MSPLEEMTRDQERRAEAGIAAVISGAVAWSASVMVMLLAALWIDVGFIASFLLTSIVGVMVTLSVGTVLIRQLRKGKEMKKQRPAQRGSAGVGNWLN